MTSITTYSIAFVSFLSSLSLKHTNIISQVMFSYQASVFKHTSFPLHLFSWSSSLPEFPCSSRNTRYSWFSRLSCWPRGSLWSSLSNGSSWEPSLSRLSSLPLFPFDSPLSWKTSSTLVQNRTTKVRHFDLL